MEWIGHVKLLACCMLSAGMIGGTSLWLETHAPRLTADDALATAKQSIQQYCARQQLSSCSLKLVNATAPATWLSLSQANSGRWEFEFYSPRQGTVEVQVPENGRSKPTLFQR